MDDEAPVWIAQHPLANEFHAHRAGKTESVDLTGQGLTGSKFVELIGWFNSDKTSVHPIKLEHAGIDRPDEGDRSGGAEGHAAVPGRSRSIDFSYATFSRALSVSFDRLPDEVSFRKCRMPDLALSATTAAADRIDCSFNLRAATIDGTLNLRGLRLSRPIEMQAIRVRDDLRAIGCDIGGDRVAFAHEEPGGRALLPKPASALLDRANIGGRLILTDCTLRGPAVLLGATVHGTLELQKTKFFHAGGTALYADGLQVDGDFVTNAVTVAGQFCMANAHVLGELDLRSTSFSVRRRALAHPAHPHSDGEALTLYRARVGGSLRLGERVPQKAVTEPTSVVVVGCVNLHGANVKGHLRIEGITMRRVLAGAADGDLSADEAAADRAASSYILNGAVIGRNLEFFNVRADRPILLVGAAVNGDLSFSRIRITCPRIAIFGIRCRVGGHVRLGAARSDPGMGGVFDGTAASWATRSAVRGIVDFSGSSVEGFFDVTALTILGREVRPTAGEKEIQPLASGKSHLALVLDDATIHRRLCLGHDESGGASAESLRVHHESAFFGTVSMVGLVVKGDAYLSGAVFRTHHTRWRADQLVTRAEVGGGLLTAPAMAPRPAPPGAVGWWPKLTDGFRWTFERNVLEDQALNCAHRRYMADGRAPEGQAASQRKGAYKPVAVDLTRANIHGCLIWSVPEFSAQKHPELLTGLPPDRTLGPALGRVVDRLAPVGEVHLTQAHVGSLLDHKLCWPDPGFLRIDGFEFDDLHPLTTSITIHDRLDWVKRQEKGSQHFTLKIYEHLIGVYLDMGTETPVSMVVVEKQLAIRDGWPIGTDDAGETRPSLIRRSFERWDERPPFVRRWLERWDDHATAQFFSFRHWLLLLCGATHRWKRPLAGLIVVVLVACSFFWANWRAFYPVGAWQYPAGIASDVIAAQGGRAGVAMEKRPTDFDWSTAQRVYPEFSPFLQALDLAVPLIDLGRARYWELEAGHPVLEWVIVIDIVLGHLFVVLLALSPIGIVRSVTRDRR